MISLLLLFQCLAFSFGTRIGFLESPQNSVANPGDTVYFNCKTNLSDESIQWAHEGHVIPPKDSAPYIVSKNFLSFELGKSEDIYSKQIGEYQCIGKESIVTSPAILSIAELKDFSPARVNKSLRVFESNNVIINCEVPFSNPPGFVQYYKDGVYLDDEVLVNGEILFLQNVTAQIHNGKYSCSVQNHITGEKKYSEAFVEMDVVSSTPGARKQSQIIYHPKEEYSVNLEDNITIPCAASGYPNPSVSWSRFGDSTAIVPSSHGLLEIINASELDGGDYMCIVDGGARQFLRKTRVIINTHPSFQSVPPSHQYLTEGENISIDCHGSGTPRPEIRWYHNGLLLIDQQTNNLHIHSANKKHSGYYQCFLINIVGSNSSVTFIRVLKEKHGENEYDEDYDEYPQDIQDLNASTLLPPSKPNITQLSPDSAMISWSIDKDAGLSISFFKIQYREFHGKKRSEWKTLDEVIDPEKRNFEIIGLHSDRKYRFRIVAVYVNNDNKPGPLSKKFKFNKRLLRSRKPKIAPVITHVLPMSETSLRLGWKMRSLSDIEGYFILYRASFSKGRPFKKITIIGGSSHSFVIEDLQPGLKYEMRVQAFNFAGVSPLSRIVRRSTSPRVKNASPSNHKPVTDDDGGSEGETNVLMEHQVRLYLLIGGILGLIVLLVIICCSINSYLQKRRAIKTYSDANAAIHEKYMDASLSQFRSAVNTRQSANIDSTHSSTQNIPGTIETSFSNKACSTVNSSSTSVTHNRHAPPEQRNNDVGYEEYTAEPSGSSWKRKRRSEEIL